MPTNDKNVFFSLDDFGISQKANENILKLAQSGKIGRVSVMSHGAICPEDADSLLATGVELDVHVDLRNSVDFKRKLKDGIFGRAAVFISSYFSGKATPALIEEMWASQIEGFQKIFGKSPDGINSHEHAHFFPPYFRILLKLSKEYGIRRMRFGKKSYWGTAPVSWILNCLRIKNNRLFLESDLDSPDLVLSFDWLGSLDSLEKYLKNGSIEVIFHPERDEEMAFLEDL